MYAPRQVPAPCFGRRLSTRLRAAEYPGAKFLPLVMGGGFRLACVLQNIMAPPPRSRGHSLPQRRGLTRAGIREIFFRRCCPLIQATKGNAGETRGAQRTAARKAPPASVAELRRDVGRVLLCEFRLVNQFIVPVQAAALSPPCDVVNVNGCDAICRIEGWHTGGQRGCS